MTRGGRRGNDQAVNSLHLDLRVCPRKASLDKLLGQFYSLSKVFVLLRLSYRMKSGQVALSDSATKTSQVSGSVQVPRTSMLTLASCRALVHRAEVQMTHDLESLDESVRKLTSQAVRRRQTHPFESSGIERLE